jgi:hypothetical protein
MKMTSQTTALGSIHGVSATRTAVSVERLRMTGAYLLPTLATGAGCWLALATVARLANALMAAVPRP